MPKYSNSEAQTRLIDYDFEMYSKAGNKAISTQLRKIIHYIEKGRMIVPKQIEEKMHKLLLDVQVIHPEVWDTEPHWHIRWHIAKCLDDNYFDYKHFELVNKI